MTTGTLPSWPPGTEAVIWFTLHWPGLPGNTDLRGHVVWDGTPAGLELAFERIRHEVRTQASDPMRRAASRARGMAAATYGPLVGPPPPGPPSRRAARISL